MLRRKEVGKMEKRMNVMNCKAKPNWSDIWELKVDRSHFSHGTFCMNVILESFTHAELPHEHTVYTYNIR